MCRLMVLTFLATVFSLSGSVMADVPPDAGYVRQSASLTLETADDLSEYRFFLESPIRIEEVMINAGEPTIIGTAGRAGAARVGTLWAIPRTSIGEFGADFPEKVDDMRNALKDGRVYRATALLTHDFLTTIRDEEKANWKDPVYRIGRNGEQGVTAVLVSGGTHEARVGGGRGFGIYSIERKTPAFWTAVLGGAALTLAFISLGAWALRRSRSRMMEADSKK